MTIDRPFVGALKVATGRIGWRSSDRQKFVVDPVGPDRPERAEIEPRAGDRCDFSARDQVGIDRKIWVSVDGELMGCVVGAAIEIEEP